MTIVACPCGLGAYDDCCGRFHRGEAEAPTAQALMRSRYSAFAVGDAGYLVRTWHPSTRPPALELDEDTTWTRLHVLDTSAGNVFDSTGTVEFVARYVTGGRRGRLHERSDFVREDRRWYYLSGVAG